MLPPETTVKMPCFASCSRLLCCCEWRLLPYDEGVSGRYTPVNFEYVNKILIPEMHFNNSGMSQFYMRFIRYTSTEYEVDWYEKIFIFYS